MKGNERRLERRGKAQARGCVVIRFQATGQVDKKTGQIHVQGLKIGLARVPGRQGRSFSDISRGGRLS